jgi:pimeloyl-ACP methyl ester carboxylesterase
MPRSSSWSVLLLVFALALGSAGPAAARTGPAGDAFYTPPAKLPGKVHGALVWSRALTGAAVVPGAGSTRVVLYRSTGIHGQPVAVSGVVSVPTGKAPKRGWPVITYAHGTTGLADQCAPSRDVDGTPVHPYNAYVFPLLQRWLKAGFAVVRTDYEGLGTPGVHPYLIGSSEARSVLDIVRAARKLDHRLSSRVLISGHSQGGHAALFAAALAPRWTPELHVRGTVAFAPASHLDEQIPVTRALHSPSALSALVADIAKGVDLLDPELDVQSLLGDAALALYPDTETQCLPELAQPSSFGGLAPADLFRSDADLGPIAKALDVQDPSHLKIRTPLRIEQGAADTTVIPLFTDGLAHELKTNGGKPSYRKYPGVDHAGIVVAAAKDATAWMKARVR